MTGLSVSMRMLEQREWKMGAETRIRVKVAKTIYTTVEVYAVTLEDAMKKASEIPGIDFAVSAEYAD